MERQLNTRLVAQGIAPIDVMEHTGADLDPTIAGWTGALESPAPTVADADSDAEMDELEDDRSDAGGGNAVIEIDQDEGESEAGSEEGSENGSDEEEGSEEEEE